jgi:hypothetical protein
MNKMTKNKEKQSHKTGDEMPHGVQSADQRGGVQKLAIASKSDVMIGIKMNELNTGRSATFWKPCRLEAGAVTVPRSALSSPRT